MNIRDFVGKRCLLKMSKHYSSTVDEYRVLEVSPSGNFVKLMNLHGNKFWHLVQDISFVEELHDFQAERRELGKE